MLRPQPFIYGRPVRGDEFTNRHDEIKTVVYRMLNGEASAIVGQPHVGKTSVLLRLQDKSFHEQYIGQTNPVLICSYIDLHPIEANYSSIDFWNQAFAPLLQGKDIFQVKTLIRNAASAWNRQDLVRIAERLAAKNCRVVLLLDEFERLLVHSNFQDIAFYNLLRSISSTTGGLTFVTATRWSVSEVNNRARDLLGVGSEFFNTTTEIALYPFMQEHVDKLLGRAGDIFSLDDRAFICRLAGRNPFLVQAMAAALFETEGSDRYERAGEKFYSRISHYFSDLWYVMDDKCRTTAVILSLMELGGRALGKRFSYGEIERASTFGDALNKLRLLGIAEKVNDGWRFDSKHLLVWHGEQWTLCSQAFAWWVRDVVIGSTQQVPEYEAWLKAKRSMFLLTQSQWDSLINAVRGTPEWAVQGFAGLVRMFISELLSRKQS